MSRPSIPLESVRNIGIIAHIDAGKTTTTERMLYYAGATHKMGEVDKGTTETDFDPEEQARGITIYGAAVSFDWPPATSDARVSIDEPRVHINLIDTPGHVDFTAEVERSLRVLDGAVCIFSAREGVEAQSETVWKQADKYHVPRLCFINKLDREGADFSGTFNQIRQQLGANPVAIELPLGEGPAHMPDPFRGVIDLIEMKLFRFDPETMGKTVSGAEIPEEVADGAQQWRETLLEELSNHSDELMTLVMEEKPVPSELIRKVLREATLAYQLQPVLCGSSLHYIGVQPLLDAVMHFLPSPLDRPPVEGDIIEKKKSRKKPKGSSDELAEHPRGTRKPDIEEPFCGLVFKVLADKHGDLCMTRIYSGQLKANSKVLNPRLGERENVSQIWHIQADRREQISIAETGQIVGIIGLRESATGDTLCDPKHPIALESITFPETVISRAIEPESSGDRKKLADTLELLKRQDPTFTAIINEETGETIIRGMGELHLEVITNRLKNDYKLNVKVHKPRVSYRETIEKAVEVTGLCDRHIGDKQLFAKVTIKMEPIEDDEDPLQLVDQLEGPQAASARELIIEDLEGLVHGNGITGNPLTKLRVTALGLETLEEHLSEQAVRIATADAFDRGLQGGGVVVLEPIMKVEVSTPDESVGTITSDLLQRRAHLREQEVRGPNSIIKAEIPLKEMFGYSNAVRSLSGGRASFSMEPHRYEPAPPDIRDQFL